MEAAEQAGSGGNSILSFCRQSLAASLTYGSSFKFTVCEQGKAFGVAGVRDAGTKRDAGVDFPMQVFIVVGPAAYFPMLYRFLRAWSGAIY